MGNHMAGHAVSYLIAFCLAGSALFSATYDVFWNVEPEEWAVLGWWQKTSLILKPLSVPLSVLAGFLLRSPSERAKGTQ
jgi:hypothetical protein